MMLVILGSHSDSATDDVGGVRVLHQVAVRRLMGNVMVDTVRGVVVVVVVASPVVVIRMRAADMVMVAMLVVVVVTMLVPMVPVVEGAAERCGARRHILLVSIIRVPPFSFCVLLSFHNTQLDK
jgi:hypothetical protein